MAIHNRTGSIWSNVTLGANRRRGPGTNFDKIDNLPAGQSLIVLCYSRGDTESFTAPNGRSYSSDAWGFVVTSDQDPGGYVADVFVDTGGDIRQQLGAQGTCNVLQQRLVTPNPYGGTLAFQDTLASNINGWCQDPTSTQCKYSGGALHIIDSGATGPSYVSCIPQSTSLNFSNFAYEVQMTVLKGFGGGIIFRYDRNSSNYYYFLVGTDGSYNLFVRSSNPPDQSIASGFSPAIQTGVNQTNFVAVVAQYSTLIFFINRQFVTSVNDSTYTDGTIGIFAYDSGNPRNEANPPVEVVFSNVEVWVL